MTTQLERVSRVRTFDGWLETFDHESSACASKMRFAIYLPPQAEKKPVPIVYWLSGLTCTEENFMVKAGAQRYAAELGVALVAPDTSPRGLGLPGEDDDWDFGTGAGFYVNATQAPWDGHYRMYEYVTRELPGIVAEHFPVDASRKSVCGHSMGGHGALVAALRNPDSYVSVSAFAPICAPTQCPWGEKAFGNYLGEDRTSWEEYDATALVERTSDGTHLLIDQGDADPFLEEQLKPELLQAACEKAGRPISLHMRAGYDHSYYYIATFIGEHLHYHAEALEAARR